MNRSKIGDRVGPALMTVCMIGGLLLWTTYGNAVQGARTESLEEKLGTVTDYVPTAISPVDQLVEVARKFKIPMGIEWVERGATVGKTTTPGQRSVRELIEEIASVSPGHCIVVDDALVRIYSPTEAMHSFNFLNIQLKSYSVRKDHLFGAQDQLRWAIRFTLEPEKYLHGYGGGYGYGSDQVFQIPKFTLSLSDVTIRQVLNRIALAQGNALWVARIRSANLEGDEPSWRRKGADGGDFPITSGWHFFPLAEIAELAKEQVVIDVMIAGMLDQRMTTIPVMLDHRLAEYPRAGTGGGSSEGISFHYGASLEKMDNDFVTISVRLKVRREGEAEFSFEEKLQVYKDRITEVGPEPRIRIRAYFERTEKP